MIQEIVNDVQAQLQAQADPQKALDMAAYMKSEIPYYGVNAPEQKLILRHIKTTYAITTADEFEQVVRALWALTHREAHYIAIRLAILYKKLITWDHLALFEEMIREGAWWDYVDMIASHLIGRLIEINTDEALLLMDEWVMDEHLWIRRTALICQLRRKDKTDAERLFSYCALRMEEEAFFIRKAIGWSLRAYSRVDPDAVVAFLTRHKDQLSGLSFREGAKQLRKNGVDI